MVPRPASDLFFAPEVDEHRELVKWWKQMQKNPFERNLAVRLMRQWSDDQCRNGALVISVMRIRALSFGFGAILALTLTACWVMVAIGLQDPKKPDHNPTATTVFRVVFALLGVGTLFFTAIGGIVTAISCHIIWRVSRSLRACGGDDALVYIPPVALLVKGPKFTWRPPFYEPEPFIQCDDPRQLASRIRALDPLL